jgi:hypothetical protein
MFFYREDGVSLFLPTILVPVYQTIWRHVSVYNNLEEEDTWVVLFSE